MKYLKNTFAILSEIIVLMIAIIWYRNTYDYEPLIMIILFSVGLITGLTSKLMVRPRIELHHENVGTSRITRGYTGNNPPIIRLGVDNPDQYWKLVWDHTLEIRNNSSVNAYSLSINYINLPDKTFIEGKIGKIEPLLAHDHREFKVKIVQYISGTHLQADEYLQTNIRELMKDAKIKVKYKDESRSTYFTIYNWAKDNNKLRLI